jgi:hypothetical protein
MTCARTESPELSWHVHRPEALSAGAFEDPLVGPLGDPGVLVDLELLRDEFLVGKASGGLLEQLEFVRQFEIHGVVS